MTPECRQWAVGKHRVPTLTLPPPPLELPPPHKTKPSSHLPLCPFPTIPSQGSVGTAGWQGGGDAVARSLLRPQLQAREG